MASTDYAPYTGEFKISKELSSIHFASAIGAGVRTVYVVADTDLQAAVPPKSITIIQGPYNQMAQSMLVVRPTWLSAKKTVLETVS